MLACVLSFQVAMGAERYGLCRSSARSNELIHNSDVIYKFLDIIGDLRNLVKQKIHMRDILKLFGNLSAYIYGYL